MCEQRQSSVENLIAELAPLDSAILKAIRVRPSERACRRGR